jgi:hypothetical protein
MKALLIIEIEQRISNTDMEKIKVQWRSFAETGFKEPLILSNATAKVLYVPDNFTEANMFTPEEAESIAKMITDAQVVITT